MKKLISLLCVVLLLALSLTACTPKTDPNPQPSETATTVRVATIAGPTGIGMAHLMEAQSQKTAKNTYDFKEVASAPDQVVPLLTTGEVDIAALPTNVAANLYNKTNGKIQLLAVNTLGVLYLLENGNDIQSVEDLRGKTIYTSGQGANPEFVLNYVLEANGINPETDVTIEFVAENTELAALMANGTAKIAMVPQPVATTITNKNENIRTALSINDVWEAAAGSENKLMMGCVVVRTEFLKEHPEEVKTFLQEYEASINKAIADPRATGSLCALHGIGAVGAVIAKAIPYCNLTFVTGETMKTQINKYYSVLFEANPQSIGGAMPNDDFYYQG